MDSPLSSFCPSVTGVHLESLLNIRNAVKLMTKKKKKYYSPIGREAHHENCSSRDVTDLQPTFLWKNVRGCCGGTAIQHRDGSTDGQHPTSAQSLTDFQCGGWREHSPRGGSGGEGPPWWWMAPVWHRLRQHPDPGLRSGQRQCLQQRGHHCCAQAGFCCLGFSVSSWTSSRSPPMWATFTVTLLLRCGLALTLSTNLVVWMAAVTEESVHQTEIPDLNVSVSHKMYRASYGDRKCECSHLACDTFKDAFYYLYPFNIEYSLFASAVAYVMWKNVGRLVEDRSHHSIKFRPKDVCSGPVMGILLVVAGLVTFIVYKVDLLTEDEKNRNEALLIHFIMNIVIVSLMSVSTVIGCVVYRLDNREHVSEKNPTRSLDVRLLLGASMGQFIISYFTIVAAVATGAGGYLNALNLSWAVLTVLQLGLQNYFIIEGLHREPFHVMQEAALHTNAHAFREHPETNVVLGSRRSKYFVTSSPDKPSWKRRVLKEVCAFLLLANIILWIMPAFGARPQFDHPIEIKFYKFTMWAAIVNIGLPFGIFYRMHSVASLFEVYLIS
ncbi:proton channel OTOP2-like isoform X4 [Anarhichas minor]|uniref:proton channel OTOP2-like isoform X4 n=1 Tax=Anarhichas minor TaxID=65739 RepID=UPI003F73F056